MLLSIVFSISIFVLETQYKYLNQYHSLSTKNLDVLYLLVINNNRYTMKKNIQYIDVISTTLLPSIKLYSY